MDEVDIKINNAYIVTVDAGNTIIEHGTLLIKGNIISGIGNQGDFDDVAANQTIDAQGNLLMPGLINAHTHAAMSVYRGMADDMPLQEWLNDYIFPAEAEFCKRESVITGMRLAALEMLRFGTTCFADMYYFEDSVAEICAETGIRAQLSQAIIDFPGPDFKTSDDALAFIAKQLASKKSGSITSIVPGPHSPYTCNEDTLKKARALANSHNTPLHIHLSETIFEYEESLRIHNKTPIKYCDDLGLFDGKTVAAHCVYVNEEDREILRNKGVGVVNNPISNMKLTSGVAPIPLLKEVGVLTGLGTDGAVSNNTLDMFEEMKIAALIHKVNNNNPTALDALSVVRMATIDNAKILGMDDHIGSLEKGKKADLIMVDINQPHLMPMYNIYSHIVYAVKGSDVDTVIVDGKVIMLNRNIAHINALDIAIDAQILANEVKLFLENKE